MGDGKTQKSDRVKNITGELVVIAALFLALAPDAFWQSRSVVPEGDRRVGGGDLTLPTLDGGRRSPAAQRGKVVLVN